MPGPGTPAPRCPQPPATAPAVTAPVPLAGGIGPGGVPATGRQPRPTAGAVLVDAIATGAVLLGNGDERTAP
ncbi:hypothetical protein ACFWY7_19360, partial [Streptomyces sp. NPDC059001]